MLSAFHRQVKFIACLILLAGALGVSGCDSVEDRIAKHYQRGVELIAEGEYAKAALEFRNVLKLNENYIPAHLKMVEIYEHDHNPQAAIGHLAKIVEIDPKQVDAQIRLARYMILANASDEAEDHIDAAIEAAPHNGEALALRAAVILQKGDPVNAQAAAQKALEADPTNPTAGLVLATERQQAGDLGRAQEIADFYLSANPNDLPLNLFKLQVLEARGDDAGVEAHLLHLAELFPQQSQFRVMLARYYDQKGNIDGAEAQLRTIAAANPADSGAALDVVRFLAKRRGVDAARAELDRLVKTVPNPFPYEMALAEIDHDNGREEEARSRLVALIARGGESQNVNAARVLLAKFWLAANNRAAASTLADSVLEDDTKNVGAMAIRAALMIDDGDYDGAVVQLRAALNEDPKNVALLQLIATAHERNGNPELAGERLAAAVSASGYATDVTMRYVRFLQGRDQPQAANTVLEEAVSRRPDDRTLLEALGLARLSLRDWDGADKIATRLDAFGDDAASGTADRIRAASLSGQRKYTETLEVLKRIGEREDDPGAVLASIVKTYVGAGRTEDAVTYVDGQLKKSPDDPVALQLRGTLHELAGETEQAEASYRAVIAAAPDSPTGYTSLARVYEREGRSEDAEKALRDGLSAVPDDAALMLSLGGLLEMRGAFQDAIDVYGALYDARPDSIIAANNYASLIADHRADDQASLERAYIAAKRLRASDVPQFQDTFGWLQYLRGDYNGALRTLIPVAEALPTNPLVRYHIGMTYAKLGKPEDARGHLQAALDLADKAQSNSTVQIRAALAELPTQ